MSNPSDCPHCGVEHSLELDPVDLTNTSCPGDAAVCIYCTGISIYTDNNGSKRAATADEVEWITSAILEHPVYRAFYQHLKSHLN